MYRQNTGTMIYYIERTMQFLLADAPHGVKMGILKQKLNMLTTEGAHAAAGEAADKYFSVTLTPSAAEAAAGVRDSGADVLLLCADEGREEVLSAAIKAAGESSCAVIVISQFPDAELISRCVAAGVLVSSCEGFSSLIIPIYSVRVRLRRLESQANTLQRKLDDSKLVSRAKLLLVSRLKMSEQEAHKYIEKTAMDSSTSRREVAISIIRTYEE